MEYHTKNAEETQRIGRQIGTSLKGSEILALVGDLGAGKTTFIQGIAEGLGVKSRVISPTFILMRSYSVSHPTVTRFYHLDTYRLEGNVSREVKNLGISDEWGNEDTVTVIEWAEKIKDILPPTTRWITITPGSDSQRIIDVK